MTISTIRPWDDWEDYAAGLYQRTTRGLGPVYESAKLLARPGEFAETAREMIRAWPRAAAHNLNLPSGRRAWTGQAACCYHHGATAMETCAAWGRLPNEAQRRANQIADAVIDEYLNGWADAETLFAS